MNLQDLAAKTMSLGLIKRQRHPSGRLVLMASLLGFLLVGEVSAQFIEENTFTAQLKEVSWPVQPLGITNISADSITTTPLIVELGYILAMETTFLGLSYLGSVDNKWGPPLVAGADIFMGLAGLRTTNPSPMDIQQLGYYAVSAGFLVKALYNFGLFGTSSDKQRFQVNFLSYNILVFTGYYLDTLD